MIKSNKLRILYLSSDENSFLQFKDEFLPRLRKEIPLKSACLCTTFADAINQLHREFDLYISEINVISEHNETGLDFYRSVRFNNEKAPFILMNIHHQEPFHNNEDEYFHCCKMKEITEVCAAIKKVLKT